MIYKLHQKDYHKVSPLYHDLDHDLVIFSVIENSSPGDIYVDNREAPTIAFLWDKTEGGYYLAGEPAGSMGNEFTVDLNKTIKGPITKEAKICDLN